MKVKSESEVTELSLTLCNPMDWSLSGSSIHGIFQARVLEWVAFAFSVTNLDSIFKSRQVTLQTKAGLVKAMFFLFFVFLSSSHVWMWELDYKES